MKCLAELLSVFDNEAPHQSTISHWYGEFKRGRVRTTDDTGLSDDSRVGAPKTAVTQENVDAVRKLIIEDRHVTYREIEAPLKISKTSTQKILHEELGVRKLVSRWIPHLLTGEQKAARVNWCQKTLDRSNSGNSKKCVQHSVWVFQGEEKPTKVIRFRSVSKKVVATFVSKAGHIATISLNEQRSVPADWYTTICLPKVITQLRKINPEGRIILHQDNVSSHKAQKPRLYLTEENQTWNDCFLHDTRADLSPNDFFTFPKIENRLRGQRFQSPEEAVDAFKNAVLDLPANEWNRQRSLWDQEWNSIVFSDESRFCLGMHDGRARVRRRRGERRNPQFFVERHVHHTVGVMVWGATAPGNMNAQRYIHEVLEPHLLLYLDILAGPTFQQDNARPQVARVTIDFFQHNDVTLLSWPPRSPDLSPIEHVLLNLQRPPQTLEALREELVVAWNEIPQEDIDHLIRSKPRRDGECVAHQGASTHY
ncbi:unnamed protein product [Acanthoscelides obtectus]|uniref:Transposase n=1 Tax=Acanthoscelides obtectus TaxID=200917 RepID=A0A9P0LEA0_ACAOB|nr:unnamed protein product [Acanthoscelides obtectus]CAK1625080.1 hypothetical protein AOBTE_LOCUS2938 [Acanthoscelides obtectus]